MSEYSRIQLRSMRRSDTGDRYYFDVEVMGHLIRVYLLPSHLAPLTKLDATPDAPNPPRWPEPGDPE